MKETLKLNNEEFELEEGFSIFVSCDVEYSTVIYDGKRIIDNLNVWNLKYNYVRKDSDNNTIPFTNNDIEYINSQNKHSVLTDVEEILKESYSNF